MSTLVDQARRLRLHADYMEDIDSGLAAMIRFAADRVQELEGKGEPVAWRHWHGEENGGWEYYEEASCADCQPLYTYPPFSVQPEKEERRPTDAELHAIYERWRDTGGAGVTQLLRFVADAVIASPSPSMVGREDTTHG